MRQVVLQMTISLDGYVTGPKGDADLSLGDGLPLLKDLPAPLRLPLVESSTYAGGTAIHVYGAKACTAPA